MDTCGIIILFILIAAVVAIFCGGECGNKETFANASQYTVHYIKSIDGNKPTAIAREIGNKANEITAVFDGKNVQIVDKNEKIYNVEPAPMLSKADYKIKKDGSDVGNVSLNKVNDIESPSIEIQIDNEEIECKCKQATNETSGLDYRYEYDDGESSEFVIFHKKINKLNDPKSTFMVPVSKYALPMFIMTVVDFLKKYKADSPNCWCDAIPT